MNKRAIVLVLAAVAATGSILLGQGYQNGFRFFGGGRIYVSPDTQNQRQIDTRSVGTPVWKNPVGFEHDVFTFARLRYDTAPHPSYGGRGGWTTDLPDADLNLSYRLQQMTSLRVDPNGRILRATDPDLRKYPFLFASAPGALALTNEEILALRAYLMNGGFMLMTDFWGDAEFAHVQQMFNQILPGSHFEDLPIEHPLYHCLFNITQKQQVANIRVGMKIPNQQIHHWVIFDPKGRIVVMALHNSDDSDGWEREGEDSDYFHTYSEKIAYPLAINIIFYVMTH